MAKKERVERVVNVVIRTKCKVSIPVANIKFALEAYREHIEKVKNNEEVGEEALIEYIALTMATRKGTNEVFVEGIGDLFLREILYEEIERSEKSEISDFEYCIDIR